MYILYITSICIIFSIFLYINNYFNAATQSPVGGFKQSGYGRENGWEGMRCFMQTKSVWLSTNPNEKNPFE